MSIVRSHSIHYDVLVVGGGISGVTAALAAARHGANTALVQSRPVLGGNGSSEMRMHITGANCHNGKADMVETGILMELLLENKRRNPYHSFSIWDSVLWEKVRFQENLTLYLNTTLDEAQTDGGRITGIVCRQATTETTYAFDADVYVDATGNGTLGFLTGADYRIGSEGKAEFGEPNAPDEPNRTTMGNTLLFIAEDKGEPVPFEKPFWAYTFTEEDLRFRGHGNVTIPHGENGVTEEYNADSGYWWIELGGTSEDIIRDTEKLTEELYKCVYGIWDHIKNGGDHGAENYALSWVGSVPGIRESRRLVGDYLLQEGDVGGNRIFGDAVAYGGWPMDEHPPLGLFHKGPPVRYLNFPGCYSIPYRCYYSKNVDNLMMAGRDISVSKMALGSVRVMGTCAVGGQAAGTAAAMAAARRIAPRDVAAHISELQQALLKDDCYIPGFRNEDPADLARLAAANATSFQPGCEPENVLSGVTRRVGDSANLWASNGIRPGGESLTLTLPEKRTLRQVRLTFDPNLSREIVPSITKKVRDRQVKGMPEELVRDYTLDVLLGGQSVYKKEIAGNHQSLNVIDLPEAVMFDAVTLTVTATHGTSDARVFEVRLY
jgi:hypothetical protein